MKIFAIRTRDICICIDNCFGLFFPFSFQEHNKGHVLFTHYQDTRYMLCHWRYNQRLINVIDDDQLYLLALLRFIMIFIYNIYNDS